MNQRGFSLMEVLTVIAVIGLLSATAFFAVNNVQSRARDAKRVADIDSIVKALDLYINQTGSSYPVATTAVCLDGSDLVNAALSAAGLGSGEIQDPVFTAAPNCFRYITDTDGTSYTIQYFLETSSVQGKAQGFNTAP